MEKQKLKMKRTKYDEKFPFFDFLELIVIFFKFM